MKSLHFLIIFPILTSFLFVSCKDDSVGANFSNIFTAQIVDENNQPVEGAGLHFIYNLENIPIKNSPAAIMPSTIINFNLLFRPILKCMY